MSNMVKLADLCIKITDGSHSSPNSQENGYPMLSVKDMKENGFSYNDCKYISKEDYKKMCDSGCKPEINDILIAKDGSYLKHVFVITEEKEQAILSSIGILKPDVSKVNPYYIKYYLSSDFVKNEVAKKYVSGSALPRIILKNFANIEIPYISLDKQNKIVKILKSIDDKIENNNKINVELESMAKTIYDYWFLQFEFPNEDGKPYKSSGGKMVWNEELKKEIPEGWEVGVLNDFILKDKGGDWGKESYEGNYTKEVTCIRGADFPSLCGYAQLVAPKRFILEKNKNKKLEDGDIIIEISGGSPTQSTGRVCYINENTLRRFNTDIITSNFCKAISLKDKKNTYWFYMLWKMLYENDVFFKYEGKTTGIKNLLFDMLCNDYKIIIPKENIIEDYHFKIKEMFNKIQQNYIENQKLSSIRDFLLPLLMNGQVRFKEFALSD